MFVIQLKGGLGNLLFQIFSILSLSIDKNQKFYILNKWTDKRKKWNNYHFFKNIKIVYNIYNFEIYEEKMYKYHQININNKNNLLFDGYFQSYKYFWNNINLIKEYINIDIKLINKIKNLINSFNKKILSIHFRLGDYLLKPLTHTNLDYSYYNKCLKNYNLDDYIIILFSDDIKIAKNKMKILNINNYKLANDYFENDEEQFLLFSFSNIGICSNSTFTLFSTYFNEIYKFNNNSKYYFPKIWFGIKGPEYNIYDLIPINNNKYILIDN